MTVDQILDGALQLHQSGRLAEAEAGYRQILARQQNHPDALYRLGLIAHQTGRSSLAAELIRKAVAAKPSFAEAYNALGNALSTMGRAQEAMDAYLRSIKIRPGYPEAHYNAGIVQMNLNLKEQAEASFRRALELKPDYLKAVNNLGLVLMDMGRLDEAVDAFNEALAIKPDDAGVLNNLAIALKSMGRCAENLKIRRRLSEANPDDPVARSSMIFAMNWDPAYDAEAILRESRKWDQCHAQPLQRLIQPLSNDRDPGRRLRVGYVAAEFWTHSVSFFFVPLLRNHDRGNFEIFCFSNVERADKITALIRGAVDGWHEIWRQSDDRVADLIRERRIDILVDLSGHSVHNRLSVFARRVAPVQINYLGYPSTTGLSMMDYRLTDSHSDPPGKTEHLHTERLLRLAGTNWCFSPLQETPLVGPSPAAAGNPVCFGSFNHLAKITPGIIDLWAGVLQAAPASRLLLKSAGFAAPSVRRQITQRLADHGVDSGRIELLGRQPSIAAHLELYGRMDIALDTFPYHGTTTTCEALWMGVPVVTLAGEVHLSRVGVSLLNNVGLPELVARDADEYVSIAAGLARDVPRLQELRRTLRSRMLASPLMDGRQFARNVESAYRQAWQRWCVTGEAKE
ncbi:MAG TPA: tetratricopeptide repeat protein [Tepidisphaeraceae bacterium]|jgi:predicted O-linked N-acetylglucosamine transferase (SPINDLY family)|nr:tetratricopeptide repeat protein [Tepidisphaeraceae bacterium]